MGLPSDLVTRNSEYRRLGKSAGARQVAYRQLFKHHFPESRIAEIREGSLCALHSPSINSAEPEI